MKNLNKTAIVNEWYKQDMGSLLDSEMALRFPATQKEKTEAYNEEHGKILGTCACCKQIAHDRFGNSFDIPSFATCELADKDNKVRFCSTECMANVGIENSIRPILKLQNKN